MAAENPRKIDIALQLVKNRHEDQILVIGQYITQLEAIAARMAVPIITGKTPNPERETIYEAFRKGEERVIVVSKVANFAIDLPDASVAIQLSGSYGSRQEEAQRLGRILRPKERDSWFYSLVSRGTVEEDFAINQPEISDRAGIQIHHRYLGGFIMESSWKDVFVSLPDAAFFEVVRNYLGPVRTPFHKPDLVGRTAEFFSQDSVRERVLSFIDPEDSRILTIVAFHGASSEETLRDFSLHLRPSAILEKLLNLEERLLIFKKTPGKEYALTPLGREVLHAGLIGPGTIAGAGADGDGSGSKTVVQR